MSIIGTTFGVGIAASTVTGLATLALPKEEGGDGKFDRHDGFQAWSMGNFAAAGLGVAGVVAGAAMAIVPSWRGAAAATAQVGAGLAGAAAVTWPTVGGFLVLANWPE